jgi:hypothetical protein
MELLLLIGFIACFFCGQLTSTLLLWLDVKSPRSHRNLQTDTYRERLLAFIFGILSIAFFVAAIVVTGKTVATGHQVRWLNATHFGALQFCSGMNVRVFVQDRGLVADSKYSLPALCVG